jgi:hypothetical protein
MGAWNARRALGLGLVGVVLGVGLPAGANAPCGRYVTTADTVLDTATQLTWQRQVSAAMSWDGAATHCTGGWRVPRLKELQTLLDVSRQRPAIDVITFPDTPPERFWTATVQTSNANAAWTVDFNHGAASTSPQGDMNHVRCVR